MPWKLNATLRGSTPASAVVKLFVGGEMPDGVVDEDDVIIGRTAAQRGFITLMVEVGGQEIVMELSPSQAEEVARELLMTARALKEALPSGNES